MSKRAEKHIAELIAQYEEHRIPPLTPWGEIELILEHVFLGAVVNKHGSHVVIHDKRLRSPANPKGTLTIPNVNGRYVKKVYVKKLVEGILFMEETQGGREGS